MYKPKLIKRIKSGTLTPATVNKKKKPDRYIINMHDSSWFRHL